jgi:hypothetical protein
MNIDKERALQALVRFGRTVAGYAVALLLQGLGDWLGLLNLSPEMLVILTPVIGALLNALAKFIRGEDVPVELASDRALGRARSIPARQSRKAFFLPI